MAAGLLTTRGAIQSRATAAHRGGPFNLHSRRSRRAEDGTSSRESSGLAGQTDFPVLLARNSCQLSRFRSGKQDLVRRRTVEAGRLGGIPNHAEKRRETPTETGVPGYLQIGRQYLGEGGRTGAAPSPIRPRFPSMQGASPGLLCLPIRISDAYDAGSVPSLGRTCDSRALARGYVSQACEEKKKRNYQTNLASLTFINVSATADKCELRNLQWRMNAHGRRAPRLSGMCTDMEMSGSLPQAQLRQDTRSVEGGISTTMPASSTMSLVDGLWRCLCSSSVQSLTKRDGQIPSTPSAPESRASWWIEWAVRPVPSERAKATIGKSRLSTG